MAAFPRILRAEDSGYPFPPGPEISDGASGAVQRRAGLAQGVTWTETFPPMVDDPDLDALIAFVARAYTQSLQVEIKHEKIPGSGRPPNGVATGAPVVAGADQSGETLVTSGWTPDTAGILRGGDVIRVAGLMPVYQVAEDVDSDATGRATLLIAPPIASGVVPANGAALTVRDVEYRTFIRTYRPPQGTLDWARGLSVTFQELVKPE